MSKNSESFSPMDMQQMMRLAQSDTAKQLFALLQSSGSDQLQAAMEQASAGNMQGAKAALGSILNDPQAQSLLRKLKDDANG